MTKQEYFSFAEKFYAKSIEIIKAKNADYTGDNENPFANFENTGTCGGGTVEQGFLFRMTDKMMRISSFVKLDNLQVKDESVTDTLRDLANYACLLAGYIESNKVSRPFLFENHHIEVEAPKKTVRQRQEDFTQRGLKAIEDSMID